jgi:hypothetical protein
LRGVDVGLVVGVSFGYAWVLDLNMGMGLGTGYVLKSDG